VLASRFVSDRDPPPGDVFDCAAAFQRETAFVQRSLRRHGIRPADVDDLTHEVLIVMWRRWSDYDQARPLRAWLSGIVFKVAHRHRLRMRREIAHAVVDEADPAPSLEDQMEARRERALVLRALEALGDRHRAVLVLHDIDELPLDELARILEVPRSTAFSRLGAARLSFAKAVRRLQAIEQAAGRTLPGAAALLAAERAEQQAPAEVDEQSIERTRRILLSLPPETPGAAAPAAPGPWLIGEASVLALAALVLTLLALRPDSGTTVAASASASSLARGLVGYWRFDETRGDLAADGSGHGNHCLLRGREPEAAWAPGRTGGAIHLDRNAWLECPPSASLARPSVELSVAAWMRLPGGRSGVQTLLARQQATGARDDFFFGIFAHTPRVDELVVNSRTWATRVATPLFGVRGRWIHVAATQARDGATTLFVNGKPVATRWSKRPQERLQAIKTVLIGGGANSTEPREVNQLFDGELDELLVYERALEATEIEALAAGGAP
jgi:RNA polymerase sigma-70 factor (ECF subfamily)